MHHKLMEGVMKNFLLKALIGVLVLSLPAVATARDMNYEVAQVIGEIEVQEMDILNQSSLPHINQILLLIEESVFEPAITSLAQSIQEETGMVDQSYCLLNLDVKTIGMDTILEYRAGALEPTDRYIPMGVALALEKCQVIQKEDRRSLYEFFSTSMITEEEYSYSDWEEDVKAKEK